MVTKNIEYYLRLSYTTTIKRGEGNGYWVARVVELPHCMTHGHTAEEALEDLEDAKREWLESNLRGICLFRNLRNIKDSFT
jgi:predicted RNase H-like HicB family nuclease